MVRLYNDGNFKLVKNTDSFMTNFATFNEYMGDRERIPGQDYENENGEDIKDALQNILDIAKKALNNKNKGLGDMTGEDSDDAPQNDDSMSNKVEPSTADQGGDMNSQSDEI